MALKKEKKFDSGIDLPEAYHRITRVDLDVSEQIAYITISIYKDQSARDSGLLPVADHVQAVRSQDFVDTFGVHLQDEAGKNVINQSYQFIKKLPEFTGAADI